MRFYFTGSKSKGGKKTDIIKKLRVKNKKEPLERRPMELLPRQLSFMFWITFMAFKRQPWFYQSIQDSAMAGCKIFGQVMGKEENAVSGPFGTNHKAIVWGFAWWASTLMFHWALCYLAAETEAPKFSVGSLKGNRVR